MNAAVVIAALRRRADGAAVLPLLGAGTAVVGGFVRDALLGREPREVDLLVEGDATAVALELAARTGANVTSHPRFGTHTVCTAAWRVDVAAARAESYSDPGALPDLRPATITEDLARRDFTVNAIALRAGELLAVPEAFGDLEARRLRVLHEESFADDPTRLVRLARYAQRLGFTVEPHTAGLAATASLGGLSPARLGAELRLALREGDPAAVLERLPLGFDAEVATRALELAPPEASRELILLAACEPVPVIEATSAELAVLQHDVVALAEQMRGCVRASELWRLLHREASESIALAGAHGAREEARRWLEELREVRLEISGDDLIAAGVAAGPQLGARLKATLRARLDGELEGGREVELRFALASEPR